MRLLAGILARATAVVLLDLLMLWAGPLIYPEDDGIGTGLTFFALVIVVSMGWGAADGARRSFGRLIVTWVAAAAVAAIGLEAVQAAGVGSNAPSGGWPDFWSQLGSGLRTSTVFNLTLVAVPALVTGGFTGALRRLQTRAGSRSGSPS